MGALAADGQGRAFYMADHLLQHILIRAVCDGKPQIQLRDLDITHHAIAVEVDVYKRQAVYVLYHRYEGTLSGLRPPALPTE